MPRMNTTSCLVLVAACFLASPLATTTSAFQTAAFGVRSVDTTSSSSSSWALGGVIRADELDLDSDIGRGGVRLAQESAVKIKGDVKHKPGSASPSIKNLLRYTGVTALQETAVKEQLSAMAATIVCTGQGKENYKDPGETVETLVVLAPMDAVRDALNSAGSAMQADKVVINIAGGDDIQVLEVVDAIKELVLDLDVATKCKIAFNSLSHSTFPKSCAFITAIGLPEDASAGGMTGTERSIAQGEVYSFEDKWYTVVEEDINTAVA